MPILARPPELSGSPRRMGDVKAILPVIYYSLLRILAFALPLALLLAVGVQPLWAALVAALAGLAVSLVFLRTGREKVAGSLYEARHRDQQVHGADEEAEDELEDFVDEAADPRQR